VTLEGLVRRDRVLGGVGLAGLALLAWAYLVRLAAQMGSMESAAPIAMSMPMAEPWSADRFLLTVAMWAVMMVAMMVPAASPMILIFATINRRRAVLGTPAVPTMIFLAGYLAIWWAFSVVAAAAQLGLQQASLVSVGSLKAAPMVGGLLLLGAGFYQFTPLKQACLARCQSPLGFILSEWREGRGGAFLMGLRHGGYCVGCCWALMALLFVAGVMNLIWVAALAALVLVEKVLPWERVVSWTTGALLVGWGMWVLVRSL